MDGIKLVAAVVIPLTLVGVAVGRYPRLRMNRATIALVGATILIACGVIPLEAAYRAVDWNTILLLLAMMILNVNLRLAGFFQVVTAAIVRHAKTPRRLLALLVFSSGVLSAVFLNDTIALMFTPLVLEVTLALRRNPLPYLVALVTAANAGSVATIVGNPQNMLVGLSSGIHFVAFFARLAPLAAAGMVVIWTVVVLVYRTEFAPARFDCAGIGPPARVFRPLLNKAVIAAGLMLAALVAGAPVPLAALVAAALLLITRRLKPERVFREIDWGLLVFFSALFVVTGAIETSGWGERLFAVLRPWADGGSASLTAASVVLSNLVSNVPAVMLFRPVVPGLADPAAAWLTLAMATTFAGNLTLLGSVANLIVAEIARHRGVHLGFVEYLKAGTPIAVLTLVLGVFWLA